MLQYYILDENKELVEVDLMTWAKWLESAENRGVGSTEINDYYVSTGFLGINYNFSQKGLPLVYETMVFLPSGDECYMRRYSAWDKALEGHLEACLWVQNGAKEEE